MLWVLAWVSAAMLIGASAASAEVTGAADNLRTGWYPDEAALAPGAVTPGAFGQAFKTPLKGAIFAQPLVANGTLLVVTEDDWAYGLDPTTGAVRWEKNFGTPVNYEEIGSCPDIKPHIGITSTPVIDTTTNVAYFVANSLIKAGESSWKMHAVSLTTGNEVSGFPVDLTGKKAENVPNVTLVGHKQLQRPALLMLEGVVYAAFGSHCDFTPYAGIIAGVSTSGQVKTIWAASNKGASVWQSGSGLISDGPKQILFTTANGTGSTPGEGDPPAGPGNAPPEGKLGESVVRAQVDNEGKIKAKEFFSPFNSAELDKEDFDIGSAGPIALPSQYFGTPAYPNLLVQGSKKGVVYLLNRNELGGMGQGLGGKDKLIEEKGLGEYGGVWDGFAVWPGDGGFLYIPGVSKPGTGQMNFDFLRYFKYGVTAGVPNLSVAATSTEQFGFGSGAPIVTSNGTNSGSAVLWITHCPYIEPGHCEKAELWAYNAVPVAGKPQRLWTASLGFASKFARPGVSEGHIYVGTKEGQLFAFSGHVLTPSASALQFGVVPVGAQRTGEVTFTNSGMPLKVSAVHGPPAPFEASGLPKVGTIIEPGQVVSVGVSMSPAAPGSFTGSVGLTTEAGETNIGLSGSAPGPASPPPSSSEGSATTAVLTSPGLLGTLGSIESPLVLDRLRVRFPASKSSRQRHRAAISYTLSSPGNVRIVVYRRVLSRHCPRAAHSCFRNLPTTIRLTVTGHAGASQFTLDLSALRPGDYRLSATPLAQSGAATATRSAPFTIR
jgi:outer membrane protein assembly factor BamB